MNLKKLLAIGVTMAFAVVSCRVFAQDDLDDLLKDLESDTSAKKAEAAPAEKPAAPAEVAPAEEEKPAEAAPEAKAEEPAKETAEQPAAEEATEEAPAAEETEESADEKPAEEAKSAPAATAPAAEKEEAVEETAEEPTAEEKAEETTKEESAEEETAEEPVAEKPAAEKPAEEKPAEEKPAPAAETEKPAVAEKPEADDEVLSLLNELDAEVKAETTATAETKPVATEAKEAKAPVAVAAPAPVKPAKPRYTGKDAELIAQLSETEKLRRQAFDVQARREIALARASMQSEEYIEAARHYRIAQRLLNDSPATQGLVKECKQGVAEGLYRAALREESIGRRDRAIKLMQKAVDNRHPKARRLLEQWLVTEDPEAKKIDVSEITHRQNDADYKEMRKENLKHLRRARQLLGTKELDRALDECELVLITEPYNQEAIRLREKIVRKMQTIVRQERKAAREGMIADVEKAWRPVYAVDAREIEEMKGQTVTTNLDNDPERTREQMILKRMHEMMLPEITFKPPATLNDAVNFFIEASRDYDRPELPISERGFNFAVRGVTTTAPAKEGEAAEASDGFGQEGEESSEGSGSNGPQIPTIHATNISFYDALTHICDSVNYKFTVQKGFVIVMPKGVSTEEMVTRNYPVLPTFVEKMDAASSDLKEMKASGFGSASAANKDEEGSENKARDWKSFFEELGVKWPEGSTIMYISSIGKLRVKNTYENLAELEKALIDLNVDTKLIEIEARFVEVCQEDLNSLGFEWILNSDYTLGLNSKIGRALGIRNGAWGKTGGSTTITTGSSTTGSSSSSTGTTGDTNVGGVIVPGGTTTASSSSSSSTTSSSTSSDASTTYFNNSQGANWVRSNGRRNVGINSLGGEGATYHTGMRYLSTLSNHISGEGYSTNDQFMRVNAFLGGADLSMILHMLSQRSDTDLLSAPKVLTGSGQSASMRVVTEYIYPTDFDVQLQSSSSSSGSSGSSSQSAILAVVEPQGFTMKEVGVILDVTPSLISSGNLVELEIDARVVDEPTWKNYGMRIPFTGNSSLQSFEGIGGIFDGLASVLGSIGTGLTDALKQTFAEQAVNSATRALDSLATSSNENMTYYDAPMEQPFFHVRSVQSKISVYPGATIVMGGLITEARKAMDDKIPFLGDLPFIGRLFRSHSEQTVKRNLLIFVTTRLVDVRGREVTLGALNTEKQDEEVKPAPETPAE